MEKGEVEVARCDADPGFLEHGRAGAVKPTSPIRRGSVAWLAGGSLGLLGATSGRGFLLKVTCEVAEVSWFARGVAETPNKQAFSRELLPIRYLISCDRQDKRQNSA